MKNVLDYMIAIITSIITLLAPIWGLLLIMLISTSIDTIVGIIVSYKMKLKFQSHLFFNVVVKLFFYLSTIILMFLCDKYIICGKLFGIEYLLAKFTTILWIYNEANSINENVFKLRGRSIYQLAKEMISNAKK